jgi:aryl-alcohol dehydrogenase-like predicted oxidoreductase
LIGGMKTLSASGLSVQPTVLGFGCASLMGRGRWHAHKLLNAAFDAGIRHFDVAPLYGQGDAEKVLGKFLETRRQQVTLTTKIGVAAPRSGRMRRAVIAIGRCATMVFPSLNAAAARLQANAQGASANQPNSQPLCEFSPARARISLDNSLRALGTEYIDVVLLHEYELANGSFEPILRFLEDNVKAGKILRFGLGSNFHRTVEVVGVAPELCGVMQFESSALFPNVSTVLRLSPASLLITHSTLSDSYRRVAAFVAANGESAALLARGIDLDVRNEAVLSHLMLACAMAMNPNGVVLFASREAHRIINNASAANGEFSGVQLVAFKRYLTEYREEILGAL